MWYVTLCACTRNTLRHVLDLQSCSTIVSEPLASTQSLCLDSMACLPACVLPACPSSTRSRTKVQNETASMPFYLQLVGIWHSTQLSGQAYKHKVSQSDKTAARCLAHPNICSRSYLVYRPASSIYGMPRCWPIRTMISYKLAKNQVAIAMTYMYVPPLTPVPSSYSYFA